MQATLAVLAVMLIALVAVVEVPSTPAGHGAVVETDPPLIGVAASPSATPTASAVVAALGPQPVIEALPPLPSRIAERASDGGTPPPAATARPEPTAADASVPTPSPTAAPATPTLAGGGGRTLYVATNGSNENVGSADRPFRTVQHALKQLRPGDTLYLRGGTYVENVVADLSIGRPDAPVLIASAPGERAVIEGLVSLQSPNHVTLHQFHVTWNEGDYDEHMFKITGGTGWTLQNSEIWGARSFANLLISGSPQRWTVRDNVIFDTHGGESNVNRSHNVYAYTGLAATGGLIERNLIFNATHGSNLKLGGPGEGDTGAADVIVRYNTLYNATQPLFIADASRNLTVEQNIIGGSARGNLVRLHQLTGSGIVVRDNLGWDGESWCDDYDSFVTCEAVNGSNVFPHEPRFDSLGLGGFHPRDGTAAQYGRYAP